VDSNLHLYETVPASETKPVNIQRRPTPLKDVQPAYPNQARASAIEGTALVDLHVSENGDVDSVGVNKSSGSRLLDEAALDAALKSTFLPANQYQGRPVAIWVRRPFRFSLGPVYYYDELASRPPDKPRVVTPPSPLGYNPPGYPDAARRKGEEGTVVVGMRLKKDGKVSTVRLRKSSGHRLLDSSVLNSVLKSEFTPARDSAGDAVEALVARTVNFSLKRNQ
jgi:protein TonB